MSSFFSQASFVMDPSVYRAGTLFVPKPTDGSGDLTITRTGDTATRVGPNGYIEKVRTNLALQSQTFENASWTKANSSITANATTAPDGTTTADKLIENTATSTHLVSQNITASNIPFTYSVYVKGDTTTRVRVQMSDLTTGDIRLDYDFITDTSLLNASGTRGSWTHLGYTKTDISGGWVRISISGIKGAGSTAAIAVFLLDASGNSVYTGDGTSGLFVWGAQLEAGDIATNYIPTTTTAVSVGPVANVPRLNYSEGCPSLLLEPQRTNSVLWSEQFDNSAWTKVSTTVTANNITSPDGYQNADKVEAFASSQLISQSPSLTVGQPIAFSVFAKAGNWGILRIGNQASGTNGAWFDVSNGTAGTVNGGTSEIIDYGNGWYRLIARFTSYISGQLFIGISDANGSTTTPAVGSNMYLWGAQVEQGAYATSYIPTLASASTRGADTAVRTGASSFIGQTEGTILIDMEFNALSINRDIIYLGTSAQAYRLVASFGNAITAGARVSSSSVAYVSSSALTSGRVKIGYGYKSGDHVLYINGVQIGTSANTSVPTGTIDEIQLGTAIINTTISDPISQTLLFKTRLPNSELAKLTSL